MVMILWVLPIVILSLLSYYVLLYPLFHQRLLCQYMDVTYLLLLIFFFLLVSFRVFGFFMLGSIPSYSLCLSLDLSVCFLIVSLFLLLRFSHVFFPFFSLCCSFTFFFVVFSACI